MPVNRFFIEIPFKEGDSLFLEGEEFDHLRVLRLKEGEIIELVNGQNELSSAALQRVEKNKASVVIENVQRKEKTEPKCILALAALRMAKLEFILEKGTEIGVTEFWIFPADFSEKDELKEKQKIRLRNILISALKQCGRLDLPQIQEFPSLQKIPLLIKYLFFGDTKETAPSIPSSLGECLFFIGPEKGFSGKELDFFHSKKIVGVRLAENILRAETAAIAAATLIKYFQII